VTKARDPDKRGKAAGSRGEKSAEIMFLFVELLVTMLEIARSERSAKKTRKP
jgi:hypothetical protein